MRNNFGRSTVIKTVIKPTTNANNLIVPEEKPNRIAIPAPTQQPDPTPSMSGETNLLLKVVWYASPDTDKQAPTRKEAQALGMRMFAISASSVHIFHCPSMIVKLDMDL